MKKHPRKEKRVELYYLPGSWASEAAKQYLEERDIAYRLLDVTKPAHAKMVAKETKQWNVPVLMAGNKAAVGFDAALYERLLGK